jgi:hypothetical protein
LISCGWWTLNREKIEASPADYWIFVLHTFNQQNMQFVIITPKELKKRLDFIHPETKSIQTYLWVTAKQECWEARGLKKKSTNSIVAGNYLGRGKNIRNFTEFLNNWTTIIRKLT